MKIRDYIIFGVILIGVIFFFQWRMSILQDKVMASQNQMYENMNNNFRQLADSMSAKAQVTVVAQPGLFDNLFNTALKKQYEEIRKQIPKVIADEIHKVKLENKYTTINKSSVIIEGDTAIYLNSDGTVLKTAKVIPLNGDSSMLIILPQEIELTNVTVMPDKNRPDSLQVFLSAINKTTGDTLRISQALTYVLPGEDKKWTFTTKPFIGAAYDVLNNEIIFKGGFNPIQYNGKRISAQFLGLQLSYGIKNTPGIEVQLVNLQLKPKK